MFLIHEKCWQIKSDSFISKASENLKTKKKMLISIVRKKQKFLVVDNKQFYSFACLFQSSAWKTNYKIAMFNGSLIAKSHSYVTTSHRFW